MSAAVEQQNNNYDSGAENSGNNSNMNTPRGGRNNNNNNASQGGGGGLSETQRRVYVQRELERMKHVINKLHSQEVRNSKRTQIAELRAREVEVVRQETKNDARVREQVKIESRGEKDKLHEKAKALREDRQQRAVSSRHHLRQSKMEMARMTKEQHRLINASLSETAAEKIDRNRQQYAVIRSSEKEISTARSRTLEKKRERISEASAKAAAELTYREDELRQLIELAKSLEDRVDKSRQVEEAAQNKLMSLQGNSPNHPHHHNNSHTNNNSRSSARGQSNNSNRNDDTPTYQQHHQQQQQQSKNSDEL